MINSILLRSGAFHSKEALDIILASFERLVRSFSSTPLSGPTMKGLGCIPESQSSLSAQQQAGWYRVAT